MLIHPIESQIQNLMNKADVPGLSIIIIENGEIESRYSYGFKNKDSKALVGDDTIFEAASLSKPLFAYGIMQMVEEEMLDLDVPLIRYLPNIDVENDRRVESITARMVLSHSAGFPNWKGSGESLKIYFQPGERFSYSGEGYFYLQKVVEFLAKEPVEDIFKKRVFTPLGMDQTSFIWKSSQEKSKATGHDACGIPTLSSHFLTGNAAFTLQTTGLNYAQFVIAMMKGEGLRTDTLVQMLTPQIRLEESCVNCILKPLGKLSNSLFWGLGWGLQYEEQGNTFWHWGDNNGFKSFVIGFAKEKRAIIVFTNSSTGLGLSIIPEIVKQIWGTWHPAFDWIDSEGTPF